MAPALKLVLPLKVLAPPQIDRARVGGGRAGQEQIFTGRPCNHRVDRQGSSGGVVGGRQERIGSADVQGERVGAAAARDGDDGSPRLLNNPSEDDVRAEREGLRRVVDFGRVAAIHPGHMGQTTALVPVHEGGVPGATDALAGAITVGCYVNAPTVPIPRCGLRKWSGKGKHRKKHGEGGGGGHSLAGSRR